MCKIGTSMNIVIAIHSAGAMGSALSLRLREHGARVLTSLSGRSAATVERALAAGMEDVSPETITTADIILSIVPPGEAVALKMSYAGISKGLTAIAAAMLLGASRSGASRELYRELGGSLPQLLSRFETGIPDMYPKAYRWVAEMREIAAFLSEDKAAALIFEGAAQLYDRLATDIQNKSQERATLDEFFRAN
jgi:Domain of unknown function (DUF1932)